MASIREHTKKDGTSSFYVLWRDPDLAKQTSASVDTMEKAEALRDLLNECGQRMALVEKKLAASDEKEVLTLRGLLELHLSLLTKPTEGTISGYRKIFENRLGSEFGNLPASEFTEVEISGWIKSYMKAGATRKTIANTTGLLSSAYKMGMRRGLVDTNPFDFIELPDDPRPGRRATFLTKTEYDLLLSFVDDEYKLMVDTDVETGLRFGEITALGPDDLLLTEEQPAINVDKAWKELGGPKRGRFDIGMPKQSSSVRHVAITRDRSLALLPLKKKKGLIFTNASGRHLTSSLFHQVVWQKAVREAREAGLRKTPRFHDLRHTHASWLLQEGVPIFVVSRRLGHASAEITETLYGHLTPEGHRQAIAGLEKALGRS